MRSIRETGPKIRTYYNLWFGSEDVLYGIVLLCYRYVSRRIQGTSEHMECYAYGCYAFLVTFRSVKLPFGVLKHTVCFSVYHVQVYYNLNMVFVDVDTMYH